MTIQELEQQLLTLEPAEQLRIIQLLTQSLLSNLAIAPTPSPQEYTVAQAIADFRTKVTTEGIEINPDEVWGNVR